MSDDPLLAPLARLLNRQISRSSPATAATHQLDGRTLAIRLRNTALTLYLTVREGQLHLRRDFDTEPDALLETTPLGLTELGRGATSAGNISMSGDPVVAQQFEQLLRHTQPDWEEELSQLVGDVAAHQVGNVVRQVFDFGQHAFRSLSRDSAEYLREERRDLPAPAEIDAYNDDVRNVQQRLERLQQDIAMLAQRVEE
ncbi:MAG: SCP2 sterol-binding domain-containing protein [Gammaproteobacteria bacterium]|nr:SCP2 sterol-binding domain-containing protein [Gammaproteobacteria bacterium]